MLGDLGDLGDLGFVDAIATVAGAAIQAGAAVGSAAIVADANRYQSRVAKQVSLARLLAEERLAVAAEQTELERERIAAQERSKTTDSVVQVLGLLFLGWLVFGDRP